MSQNLVEGLLLASWGLLLGASALAFFRLFRGPQLSDRVVALDLIGLVLVAAIIVAAVWWRQPIYLDAVLAFAMVSFLATVGVARYIEKRGGTP